MTYLAMTSFCTFGSNQVVNCKLLCFSSSLVLNNDQTQEGGMYGIRVDCDDYDLSTIQQL